MDSDKKFCKQYRHLKCLSPLTSNSRKGQRTSQKYRNLVGSDQQMQRYKQTIEKKFNLMFNLLIPYVLYSILLSCHSLVCSTVQLFLFSIFVILSFISYFNGPHFIVILYRLLSLLFKL